MPEQTTTTTVPDTVAQQIAALEQRITALPPELRAQFQEMLELTRDYERLATTLQSWHWLAMLVILLAKIGIQST